MFSNQFPDYVICFALQNWFRINYVIILAPMAYAEPLLAKRNFSGEGCVYFRGPPRQKLYTPRPLVNTPPLEVLYKIWPCIKGYCIEALFLCTFLHNSAQSCTVLHAILVGKKRAATRQKRARKRKRAQKCTKTSHLAQTHAIPPFMRTASSMHPFLIFSQPFVRRSFAHLPEVKKFVRFCHV